MPAVPYTGALSVAPAASPTPRYEAKVTGDMFGVNVAQSIGAIGKAVSGVGDELFARALAMQDVKNHSDALEADAQFSKAAIDISSRALALKGANAVDYFQSGQFDKELTEARKAIREPLNVAAQRIYDQHSVSTHRQMYGNMANHAAKENLAYSLQTHAANSDAALDAIDHAPENDDIFKAKLETLVTNTQAAAGLAGSSPEKVAEDTKEVISKAHARRIMGMAKVDPVKAAAMLGEAKAKGILTISHAGEAERVVKQQQSQVWERVTAKSINEGSNGEYTTGKISTAKAAAVIADQTKQDYDSVGPVIQDGPKAGAFPIGKYGFLDKDLPALQKEAGLPVLGPAAFASSPEAQDRLFATLWEKRQEALGTSAGAFVSFMTPGLEGNPAAWVGHKGLAEANAYLAKNATKEDKSKLAYAIAARDFPNDPIAGQNLDGQVMGQHNVMVQKHTEAQNSAVYAVTNYIVETGATSIDDLKRRPEIFDQYNSLEPVNKARMDAVMDKVGRDPIGSRKLTQEQSDYMLEQTVKALEDPAEFVKGMETDKTWETLPPQQVQKLLTMREKAKKNLSADPDMTAIKKQVEQAGLFESLGLTDTSDEAVAKRRERWLGGIYMDLQQEIRLWGKDKVMTPENIAKIVREHARTTKWKEPGLIYGENVRSGLVGEEPIPPKEEAEIRNDLAERYQIHPKEVAPSLIQRAWAVRVNARLNMQRAKAAADAAKAGPFVGPSYHQPAVPSVTASGS